MLQELKKILRERKCNKSEATRDFIANNKFCKKASRSEWIKIYNKYRHNNVPRLESRVPIVMKLYNHCLDNNNFSFYKNINYICNLINHSDADTLYLHKNSYCIFTKPFKKFELKSYNQKLYKKINEHRPLKKSDVIVLGLSSFLTGVNWWQKNGLFNFSYISFEGRIVYYAVVRKEDKIETRTYDELVYFSH